MGYWRVILRSEDEGLTLVRAKVAGKLAKRHRWQAMGGGAAALVLAVVALAVVATDGGDDEASIVASDGTGSPADRQTSTSTSITSSTSQASSSDDTTPTDVPTTTTTSAAVAGATTCDPSQVRFAASPTAVGVRGGETVVFTVTAANEAGRDCAEATTSVLSVTDAAGREVANRSSNAGAAPGAPPWRSGETRSEEVRWESRTLDGAALSPGRYMATVTWHATDDTGNRAEYRTAIEIEVRD